MVILLISLAFEIHFQKAKVIRIFETKKVIKCRKFGHLDFEMARPVK